MNYPACTECGFYAGVHKFECSQYQPRYFETYIGACCREWILALGFPTGRCGICGEIPTYVRDDDGAPCKVPV